MDGQKDAATRQYEREIRIGMSLLGVLSLVFVCVLARRVWIENSQIAASPKKPVYLSRAERDALRSRSKAPPLYSAAGAASGRRLSAVGNAAIEKDEPLVPDLEIEEDGPQASVSRVGAVMEGSPYEPSAMPRRSGGARRISPRLDDRELSPSETDADEEEAVEEGGDEPANEFDEEPTPPPKPNRTLNRFSEPEPQAEEEPAEEEPGGSEDTEEEASTPPLEEEEESEATPAEAAPAAAAPIKPGLRLTPPNAPTNAPNREPEAKLDTAEAAKPSEGGEDEAPKEPAEVVRKKTPENPWKPKAGASGAAARGDRYKVVRGDTLKSIARKQLGDEARWKEIYDLNRSEIGDDFTYLRSGLILKLPPSEQTPPEAADPAATRVQEPISP